MDVVDRFPGQSVTPLIGVPVSTYPVAATYNYLRVGLVSVPIDPPLRVQAGGFVGIGTDGSGVRIAVGAYDPDGVVVETREVGP